MPRRTPPDEPFGMIHDLRLILDGWEYEPGRVSVRKIIGTDGREKLQMRVDLGLLQFETVGRPDGARPHGFESYLDYCEARLREHIRRRGRNAGFTLTAEDARELRHEAHLYYQRFLSFFVLEEFEAVERDTARNLRLFDLCRSFGGNRHAREALEPQRAYTIMMNVRARVYAAARRADYERAIEQLEAGIRRLEQLFAEQSFSSGVEVPPELGVLHALRREILEMMPPDAPPRLNWELQIALDKEDYEQAAQLRDRLAAKRKNQS